ncbi:MAG: epimerase, partial [Candidatus Rokuibacteriota bacterium]
MRVFVTGATGFVTGNVTSQLLARGDEVRALVRDAARGQTLARAGVTLVKGDLSDGAAL